MTTTRTLDRVDIDSMLRAGAEALGTLLGAKPKLQPGDAAGFSPQTTMAMVVDATTIVFGVSVDQASASRFASSILSDADTPLDESTLSGVGQTVASQFFTGIEQVAGQEFTDVEPEPFDTTWRIELEDAAIDVGVASIPIGPAPSTPTTVSRLSGVRLDVSVELGRARVPVKDLLALDEGGVIRLGRPVGEPVDLVVNGTVTARGEIVVVDGRLGLRITSLV